MPAYTHNQIRQIRMIISLSPVFFLSKHFQPLTTAKMGSYTTASLNKRQSFCMFSSHIMVCFVLLSFGHFHPEYNVKPAQSRGAFAAQNSRHLGYFLFNSITNVPIPASERVVLTSTLCMRACRKMQLPPAFCNSSQVLRLQRLQRATGHVGNVLDLWAVEHIARQRTPQAARWRQDPIHDPAKRAPTRTCRSRPLRALVFPVVVVLSVVSAFLSRAPHRFSFPLSPRFFLQP